MSLLLIMFNKKKNKLHNSKKQRRKIKIKLINKISKCSNMIVTLPSLKYKTRFIVHGKRLNSTNHKNKNKKSYLFQF
jgi:hypothetical protein